MGDYKVCAICGKRYRCCPNLKDIPGVFRWQNVACSPKCGATFIERMEAKRDEQIVKSMVVEYTDFDDDDEDDEEDDFDEIDE